MKIYLILIFVFLIPVTVFADGGFFYTTSDAGYSADQKAILVYEPDIAQETMVIATKQDWADSTNKKDFAWVVPVPSLMNQDDFTTMEHSDYAFESLFYLTEPSVYIYYEPPVCGSCMADAPEDKALSGETTVIDSFQVEDYQIQILTSEDSENMQNWLQQNGYFYSEESIPVLDYYIQKNWYFTAVKVNILPDSVRGSASSSSRLNPLQMTFSTDKPIYPLRISSATSNHSKKSEILLYVFAPYRVTSTNYSTVDMELEGRTFYSKEEFQDYYNYKFNLLLDNSEGRAFIVEYAAPLSYHPNALETILESDKEYYLTRLRTEIFPNKMDEDVEFAQAETDEPLIIGISTENLAKNRFIYLASILVILGFSGIYTHSRLLKRSFVIISLTIIIIALVIF